VAENDTAAQETSLAGLRAYHADFSQFLADANPFLSASALEGMLEMHTTQLVGLVTAFGDGDLDEAYGTLREAYAHTETLAAGSVAPSPTSSPSASPIRRSVGKRGATEPRSSAGSCWRAPPWWSAFDAGWLGGR